MRLIKNLKYKLAITALIALYSVVLYIGPVSCIFMYMFGVPCPGCGMTRALLSVLRFDFKAAFSYHFMFWSVPVLYVCFLRDGKLFESRLINVAFYVLVAIGFALNWVSKIVAVC